MRVRSRQRDGYPENVQWTESRVTFAAVHVVGSNNSLVPWTGYTAPTPGQTAEVGRTAAGGQGIHDVFDRARRDDSRSVMAILQAHISTTPGPPN